MNRETIERADYLLERVREGIAGPGDYEELLQLMDEHPEPWFTAHIQQHFSASPINIPGDVPSAHSPEWQQVLQNILEADKPVVQRSMRTWYRVAAAAVVVLAAGTAIWFSMRSPKQPVQQNPVASIAPGRNGAVLTLGDGSIVELDSLGNGIVTAQGGANVVMQNGQLAYEPSGNTTGPLVWNTIATPKGRQFRLTLPDGTGVWLNAASSIRYPAAFHEGERKVILKGEAYFEVTKNAVKPFRVMIGDTATVEVLGTGFNVNAYPDEPAVRTTLMEGSVRMQKPASSVLLQPGQQAIMQQKISIDPHANIQGAVAWKNGQFNFEGASVEEFMRQLSRWYDIEVVYKGQTPQKKLRGKMGRDLTLTELLDGLADFGIGYQLQGRKLIIQ